MLSALWMVSQYFRLCPPLLGPLRSFYNLKMSLFLHLTMLCCFQRTEPLSSSRFSPTRSRKKERRLLQLLVSKKSVMHCHTVPMQNSRSPHSKHILLSNKIMGLCHQLWSCGSLIQLLAPVTTCCPMNSCCFEGTLQKESCSSLCVCPRPRGIFTLQFSIGLESLRLDLPDSAAQDKHSDLCSERSVSLHVMLVLDRMVIAGHQLGAMALLCPEVNVYGFGQSPPVCLPVHKQCISV